MAFKFLNVIFSSMLKKWDWQLTCSTKQNGEKLVYNLILFEHNFYRFKTFKWL